MDLPHHSLQALDWPVLLDALAGCTRTHRGARAARGLALLGSVEEIRACYRAVAEVLSLRESGQEVPAAGVADIEAEVVRATRGVVLDPGALQDIGRCLVALDELRRWLDDRRPEAPELASLAAPIVIDGELRQILSKAFDELGQLSAATWPELGVLRGSILGLKGRIRSTLEQLVHGGGLGDQLQDAFFTERDGRWVVPVKPSYKRHIGIVHGTSASGGTVFVEPAEIVAATNELREAEAALEREERRILAALSIMVGQEGEGIVVALEAAREIDLAAARASLGERLRGVVPKVMDEGVLRLQAARHPVLTLRGVPVVGNDLALDGGRAAMILSGPNAGGKTVALKTIGQAAALVRAAIPVPAEDGARVDLFDPLIADIGDQQTVEGDLSTFSAHIETLREVLQLAGSRALVLLDEVGTGTDPAQGAVLGQAVVEALLAQGARVVVTTHYAQLKGMGAADPRVLLAAVQVVDGQPSYKVMSGLVGESYAFAVARRHGMPEAVVTRARELLDAGTRELSDLMEQIGAERAAVRTQTESLAERERRLRARSRELEAKLEEVEARRKRIREEVTAGFQARLKAQERELASLIAALQANPDMRGATETLASVRAARAAVLPPPAPAPPPPARLEVGDPVRVVHLGTKGRVLALLGGDKVEVEVGSMRMRLDRAQLAPVRVEKQRAAESPKVSVVMAPESAWGGVRMEGNTIDLRGLRVDVALERAETGFDRLVLQGQPVAYVLHGHGTGALKSAVRGWLPDCHYVKKWRPANPDEGGDAFTVVQL